MPGAPTGRPDWRNPRASVANLTADEFAWFETVELPAPPFRSAPWAATHEPEEWRAVMLRDLYYGMAGVYWRTVLLELRWLACRIARPTSRPRPTRTSLSNGDLRPGLRWESPLKEDPVLFVANNSEDGLRRAGGLGREPEAQARHRCLKRDGRLRWAELQAELRRRIGEPHGEPISPPGDSQAYDSVVRRSLERRFRLVDDRQVVHIHPDELLIAFDAQRARRDRRRPVEAVWCNGLVEAGDLIGACGQAQRAWEQVQSNVDESALMMSAISGDVLTLHEAHVGARTTKFHQLAVLVMASPRQNGRGHHPAKVEDLRRLAVRGRRHIVVPEPVDLRDGLGQWSIAGCHSRRVGGRGWRCCHHQSRCR